MSNNRVLVAGSDREAHIAKEYPKSCGKWSSSLFVLHIILYAADVLNSSLSNVGGRVPHAVNQSIILFQTEPPSYLHRAARSCCTTLDLILYTCPAKGSLDALSYENGSDEDWIYRPSIGR